MTNTSIPEPVEMVPFGPVLLGQTEKTLQALLRHTLTGTGLSEPEWVTLTSGSGLRLCFQESADHQRPTWPEPGVEQQVHLDFTVEDLDEAEEGVLALGASRPDFQPGETWRVFIDPAGHPFCLYEEG